MLARLFTLLSLILCYASDFLPNSPPSTPPRLLLGQDLLDPRNLGPVTKDLSKFTPIRITINLNGITALSATAQTLIKNDIFPAVSNYYSKMLSVHPYLAPVFISGTNKLCNTVPIPDTDIFPTGVTADFVIYVGTTTTDGTTIGTQDVCITDPSFGNSIASGFLLSKPFVESAKRDDIYDGVLYLFGLALGFGSDLYKNARKNGWNLYADSEMFRNVTDDSGKTTRFVITPSVLTRANQTFASKNTGVPITDKAKTIEWSSRAMLYDIMSDTPLTMKTTLSLMSLAWFQDLGWYSVNFAMGGNLIFGYGDVGFLDNQCTDVNGVPNFPDFCNINDKSTTCDVSRIYKSTCNKPSYLAGCPAAIPNDNGSCLDIANAVPGTELEEFCPECRCFIGTHTKGAVPVVSRAICHRVVCTATNARVRVGDNVIDCPVTGGTITVQGMAGLFFCPSFQVLCPTYGCPKACSGYGSCLQGKCVCDSGFYGDDCSIKLPITVKTATTPPACIDNALLNASSKCECKAGFYYEYITQKCLACNASCATCAITQDWCLTCPANSNSGLVGTSGIACACFSGFFRNDVTGKCETCDERCQACDKGATNCLSCKPTYIFQSNGQCLCPASWYQDTTVTPKVCKQCPSGCDSCTSATQCVNCMATFVNVSGTCKCSAAQYLDSVTNQCRPCYSSCLECGAAANICSKCSTGFIFDPTYKICTASSMSKTVAFITPNSDWMNSNPSYLVECFKGSVYRDFCKPLVKRGLWFDVSPGYFQLGPNKLSITPVVLPSVFLFSSWIRPDASNYARCILSKTQLGKVDTSILTFCLSSTNTVYLTARTRGIDISNLGKEYQIRIETVINILYDKWAALKFKFEAFNDYMGRPGTMATILIDQMVYQQTFFPTVMFEDILDMSDQRFVIGGQWKDGWVQNRFFGYISELAFVPSGLSYPSIPACGCAVCGGFGTCMTNCGITESDTSTVGVCAANQTRE